MCHDWHEGCIRRKKHQGDATMTQELTAPNPVKQYFTNIWTAITTSVKGLGITWEHMWRKPVTVQYPEQEVKPSPNFRGLHVYDIDNCDACFLCAKACPVECLTLVTEGRGKNAVIKSYSIDYSKCLFCNLCCEPCPSYAIYMGSEWDLSAFSREGCVVNFNIEQSTADEKKNPEIEARKAYRAAAPSTSHQDIRARREKMVIAGDPNMVKWAKYEAMRQADEAEKAAKKAAAAKAAAEKAAAAPAPANPPAQA